MQKLVFHGFIEDLDFYHNHNGSLRGFLSMVEGIVNHMCVFLNIFNVKCDFELNLEAYGHF